MWKQRQLELHKKQALKQDTELFQKICKNCALNPPTQIPPIKLTAKTGLSPITQTTITTTCYHSASDLLELISLQLQVDQNSIQFTLSEVLAEEGLWFPSVECLSFIPTKTAVVLAGKSVFHFTSKNISPREVLWELSADPESLFSTLPPEILTLISNYSIEAPTVLSVSERQRRDAYWDVEWKYRWVTITVRALVDRLIFVMKSKLLHLYSPNCLEIGAFMSVIPNGK
jgi:hypothetical protein